MDNKIYDNYLAHGLCYNSKDESGNYTYCHRGVKLSSTDEYKDIPESTNESEYFEYVEVRFKNNRKDFFFCADDSHYKEGEIVAVEANTGHDIGIVSLSGLSAARQMKRKGIDPKKAELKKIYRKAKANDIEKWYASIDRELPTMQKAKGIISSLRLQMKLNDVEFQGDGTKAIFHYTADERVDFRILIKMLAEEFKIRIEMRQIGARQESAKLGGLGACGRELCCCSFINSFQSVSTSSARIQQLSLNPQKLAGQCGKLKCCLNFELPVYNEILKAFPDSNIALKTKKGRAFYHKSDIFKNIMWYHYENEPTNLMALPIENVRNVITMNKKGTFPPNLEDFAISKENKFDEVSNAEKDDISKLAD